MGFASAMHTLTGTKKSLTGYDTAANRSKPLYAGAASTFACSMQKNPGRKTMTGAREVEQSFTLQTYTEILLTDLVWAPGANTSDAAKAKRPVRVTSQLGFDGEVLYEAEFIQ